MALYVHTPDRKIVDYGPGQLPPSWQDENGTYRLDMMPPAELGSHGWLLYVEQRPGLGPHQKYGDPTITFGATRATYTYPVIAMTPEEIAAADSARWVEVRAERYRLMLDSDWRTIRALELGEPRDPGWEEYRQALRDVPQTFTDPWTVVWPTPPSAAT